ncbi:hypothetical protein JCM9957A_37490 [Kineosporia succinea]|uniref:YD repeat-containing protein n=1 Tax=Kineosporia succinea TaxID=84632 RepID=A0ABT9NZ95_9ACTN|nr:hypothetical protein [Kineosporia succinea]
MATVRDVTSMDDGRRITYYYASDSAPETAEVLPKDGEEQ